MKIKSLRKVSILLILIILSISLLNPSSVEAQSLGSRLGELQSSQNANQFLERLVALATGVASIALIGLSVYAGYIMTTSQGNPEKLNEAREVLTNAVIGFAFITLAVAVLLIISEVLGLNSLFN